MNINQLDRMIDHFFATYKQWPEEMRANPDNGQDLLSQIQPPRKIELRPVTLSGVAQVYYRNIFFYANTQLLNSEIELIGGKNAAKYFADEFDDGPITKVSVS